jgi:chromosome segregation ATPase
LTHRSKVRELAGTARSGPIRENLDEIAGRVNAAVDEAWQIGKRGHALSQARGAVATAAVDREISALETDLAESPDSTELEAAREALLTQRATADRLDGVIRETDSRLRLMNARLGEVVSRAAELAAQMGGATSVSTLSSDVDGLLDDMEALRQALDELDGDDGDGLPASGTG